MKRVEVLSMVVLKAIGGLGLLTCRAGKGSRGGNLKSDNNRVAFIYMT